jgi:hypothetical protein
MSAPITLTNPRHEAFALALARGHLPATAYRLAGFSDSNAKARALALAQEPHIAARIQHLRACLPHIETVHQHFAPSLLLVPETRGEMIAWLWQIANGTRAVVPTQLRAATLLCRLKGWHLKPPAAPPADPSPDGDAPSVAPNATPSEQPAPPPKPPPLIPSERATLARMGRLQAESEATLQSLPAEQTDRFYSTMADLAIIAAHRYPETRPVPCITGTPEPLPRPFGERAGVRGILSVAPNINKKYRSPSHFCVIQEPRPGE